MLNNNFFENCAVCEIMWENVVERVRPQMIIWRMRIACWIPKATNTHTGRVILFVLQLQQWLYEHTSMLRYTYISCLVTTGLVLPEHGTLVRKHVEDRPLIFIYNEHYELGW